MGCFVALLAALTVQSVVFAEEGCPSPSAISPCTCDGEGVNCMRATSLDQIRKAFRANFPDGGALYVYIQGTPISEVPADLFSTFKAENFYIEVNKITKVNMKCFDHTANYIKSISFFGNELTSFDFGYIKNLPLLGNLNLGRNKITTIPSNAFNHNNLEILTLAKNEINSIGPNAFLNLPNLSGLNLGENKLTSLGDFSIALLTRIPGNGVSLMGNQISSISATAFHNASPQVLFIGFNKLSVLKQDVFGSLLNRIAQHGGMIEVSNNPLTCKGCDYGWIVDNKYVLNRLIGGFTCLDGTTGIDDLTRSSIGC